VGAMKTRNSTEALEHAYATRGLWAACDPTGFIMQLTAKLV